MGRKKKKDTNLPSKFKNLCDKLRIDNGRLTETEQAEKMGFKSQSTLSLYETKPEGPPLELVEIYADFFNLTRKDRFEFYLAALESSKIIKDLDLTKISSTYLDIFRRFLAFILIDKEAGAILEALKNDKEFKDTYGFDFFALTTKMSDLEVCISNFLDEGIKDYKYYMSLIPKKPPLIPVSQENKSDKDPE